MDDNKKDNAWDELLQDLGAQPDESAFERHQPPPQEIPPTVDWEAAEAIAEQAKPSPSDWNSLAESLGLEVEDAPTELSETNDSESAPDADAVEASEGTESPDVGESLEPEAEPEEFVLAGDDQPADELDAVEEASYGDSGADELNSSVDTEQAVEHEELPPLPSQMDQAMNDTSWTEDSADASGSTEDEADPVDGSEGHGMSGEAARSAFDALFADGASSWGSAFLPTPKPGDPSPVSTSSVVDNMFDAPEPRADGEASDGSAEDGDDSEKPKRKRSRRRRRGGRGRKSSADATAEGDPSEESSVADQDEPSDELSERPKRSRRRRSGQRARPVDADLEGGDEGADSEGAERPRGAGRGRQRHRNIPTWTEAIGMIVDSNLEQRAKSPSKPQSSRGGRGRGGRRRGGGKKSENK